jgi:hypothetical protein
MKPNKINDLLEKCGALDQALQMAHEEAIAIQKLAGTENLDVMHIANAREIVSMRIGYLTRLKESAEEKSEADEKEKQAKAATEGATGAAQ